MIDEDRAELTQHQPSLPVLSWKWVGLAALGSVVVTSLVVWLLVARVRPIQPDEARAELDAIRTALSVGLGAGGAFALWLATRRQRSTEIQLQENARIADGNNFDATERRITELYSKAVELLGSDKAPVRLGGLYALERLAQDNPSHRQTIVNVICAYLRMPFTLPDHIVESPENSGRGWAEATSGSEELLVRRAAQDILREHLRNGPEFGSWVRLPGGDANPRFWPGMDLHLAGATLVDLDLAGCKVRYADFARTRFLGGAAEFLYSEFDHDGWFYEATFDCFANFWAARFNERAVFTRASFKRAEFQDSYFHDVATFHGAEFTAAASFYHCYFRSEADFSGATVDSPVSVSPATRAKYEWPDTAINLTKSKTGELQDGQRRVWPDGWHESDGGFVYGPNHTQVIADG